MLNVLLPIAGASSFFDIKQYPYPVPLIEIRGRPMIERVIANLRAIGDDVRFIFVVRGEDCRRFHLDNTLSLLAPGCQIVKLEGETGGALCSALMAISHINNDDPLVVANSDQIFVNALPEQFDELRASGADAGCLCFDSVHPRWSYVRVEDGLVTEAAEKTPISRNAIAGFYYFREGQFFAAAAMRTILNRRAVDNRYFIAPVLNELILEGRKVAMAKLPDDNYISFYTPQRLEEFERSEQGGGG